MFLFSDVGNFFISACLIIISLDGWVVFNISELSYSQTHTQILSEKREMDGNLFFIYSVKDLCVNKLSCEFKSLTVD
jgi:hypothetical protein